MGLSDLVARRAVRTAHVLVVEAPGHAWTRMTLERACGKRGWRLADSAADADVLAVCGMPGPELRQAVEALWEQLPGPRARIEVTTPAGAQDALALAERHLLDADGQRADAAARPTSPPEPPMDHEGMDHEGMDHEGMDHAGMDHAGMDHAGMDHEGMDHEGMDMAPAGIPLAQGGQDRDGLEMDILRVRLGPVLPHWPAGLVLHCALQGDVITQANVEAVDAGTSAEDQPPIAYAALRCDSAARLLALAGSPAAVTARQLRDALLEGTATERVLARVRALRARVARSRMLHWSLGHLGTLEAADVEARRLPDHLSGDCYDRLLGMLDRAVEGLAAEGLRDGGVEGPQPRGIPAETITHLVTGLDLAAARLVVASLDLDAASVAAVEEAHV